MNISYEWEAYNKYCSTEPTLMLDLYPTMKCNFSCEYCYMKDELSNDNLKEKNFINQSKKFIPVLFNKFKEVQKIQIHILGGEPSLVSKENIYNLYNIISKNFTKFKNITFLEIYIFTNLARENIILYYLELYNRLKKKFPNAIITINLGCSFHETQLSLSEFQNKIKSIYLKGLSLIDEISILDFGKFQSKRKLRKKYSKLRKFKKISIFKNSIDYKITYSYFFTKKIKRICYCYTFGIHSEGLYIDCPYTPLSQRHLSINDIIKETFIFNCKSHCQPSIDKEYILYKKYDKEHKIKMVRQFD